MSSPKWTKEQQAVIDSRNSNLLVAAAAGSGKTAVLVERIIQMITDRENPIDIDKLLVVTFTNAAASEMRERIGDAIGKALDKDPENRHLQNQLVLLNKASITTIHSFCLEVIKSNFHRINLDPNFRIGDTTECTLLKQEAIEEVFEELYVEQNEGFLNLVESYAEKRGDSNLQEIILGIYNFSMASPDPKEWLEYSAEQFNINDDFDFSKSIWANSILDTVYMEVEGIESSMRKSLEELAGIEELETYLIKFRSDYQTIKSILEACDADNENSWNDTFKAMSLAEFENYVKGVKKVPKDAPEYITEIKKRADDIRKNAKKTIQDMVSSVFRKENNDIKEEIKYLYKIVKSISETVLKFEDAYSNKKRDKGIIDFNDIEHFALKILIQKDEDGNDIPSDIALSYRDKFYEIFIDEYQDSNFVQEVLLSNIAKIKTPNRFMVGDVKQSIYRFRQAKPEIFLKKYRDYDTEKGALHRKIMLYKNFRSREEVVNCANYIFENTMSKQIGDIDYTEDERLNLGAIFKENENENAIVGGPSEIHLIQTKQVINDSKDAKEKESDEDEEEIDNIQIEARMVGKIIKEMMHPKEDGKIQMVYDKHLDDYRPVEFKDIVILLRATSAWAPVFADELMDMDIPTYADIGVGYFDTIEIKTIMSLLQVIDNPMQDIPWYKENKRNLPWRDTKDPYRIWISEIILQQTRVAQGYDYFVRFMQRFPDVTTLAEAEEDEVMKYWQGLGYYSRARNLHAAAKSMALAGGFPTTYDGVLALKGVGEYTAAAICSFAYDMPCAVVDGNVYRVLSRWLGIDTPIDSTVGKKLFAQAADELLDKARPALYNQAIMDFGALQCTPASPNCLFCPLADGCLALAQGKVDSLPVKQHKTKVTHRYFHYIYVRTGECTFIRKRTGNDIWKNLYEPLLIETDSPLDGNDEAFMAKLQGILQKRADVFLRPVKLGVKHVLSHRVIHANFYELVLPAGFEAIEGYQKVSEKEIHKFAVSNLVYQFFSLILEPNN